MQNILTMTEIIYFLSEASDEEDVESIHSEKSIQDEIKENDFTQDEPMNIIVEEQSFEPTIDIIGDDIEDAFNFVPMSDNEVESTQVSKPEPEHEQVKVVSVTQPIPQAPLQAPSSSNGGDTKKIIFAPGAMDLTDM